MSVSAKGSSRMKYYYTVHNEGHGRCEFSAENERQLPSLLATLLFAGQLFLGWIHDTGRHHIVSSCRGNVPVPHSR